VAYCAQDDTHDDLLAQISEAELIQLTDDAATGEIDTDKVDRAIADADAEIDGYLGKQVAVPISPVPPTVRKWSVALAIYNLHLRKGWDMAPDHVRRLAYRDAVAAMKEYAAGRLSLGVDDPDPAPSDSDKVQVSGPEQVFSRDSMKGF
jgi:phage gp36-like protein